MVYRDWSTAMQGLGRVWDLLSRTANLAQMQKGGIEYSLFLKEAEMNEGHFTLPIVSSQIFGLG